MRTNSHSSYVGFHSNNEILYRAKINDGRGIAVSGSYLEDHRIGQADVIDIDGNGRAELKREPAELFRKRFVYNEPVLSESIDDLNTYSRRQGKEILTGDDLGTRLGVKDYGVDIGSTSFQNMEEIDRNFRTLGNLTRQLVGNVPGANWAVSPATREFYIFKPRESTTLDSISQLEPAASRPLKVETFKGPDFTREAVFNSGEGALTVSMQDDESVAVRSTDGSEVRLENAIPKGAESGIKDVLSHAYADPDFGIESVYVTHSGPDNHSFMVTDNTTYYEYSSKSGFSQGELGS